MWMLWNGIAYFTAKFVQACPEKLNTMGLLQKDSVQPRRSLSHASLSERLCRFGTAIPCFADNV
eukprot:482034-Karenia_brevis.AAC.1